MAIANVHRVAVDHSDLELQKFLGSKMTLGDLQDALSVLNNDFVKTNNFLLVDSIKALVEEGYKQEVGKLGEIINMPFTDGSSLAKYVNDTVSKNTNNNIKNIVTADSFENIRDIIGCFKLSILFTKSS